MTTQIEHPSQSCSLKDMIIFYLIWFFLAAFNDMTKQLVLEGSLFLTQAVHYSFFISLRLLFVPIALYILYRRSITLASVGLTFHKFGYMLIEGFKVSLPILPLTLFLIHLPLVQDNIHLRPLIIATRPDDLATSLVYFIFLFFMTLIPAFAEEFLFRGLTFPFLQERIGTVKALFLNGIVYGVFYMPFNFYFIIVRIIIGFFATYLFWRTKNLIPSTILQTFFHATFILYLFGGGWW